MHAWQLFKKASEEDRTQVGLRVFHCFLKQNCTHPVNIPIGQSSRIEEELRECVDAKRQLPITIFDQSAGAHARHPRTHATYDTPVHRARARSLLTPAAL